MRSFEMEGARGPARFTTAECVGFNIRKASRAVTQLYDTALGPCGLRVTQFTVLRLIERLGDPTISQLAAWLVMDRTTLTRDLKPLVREGLIRIGSGRDRRLRLLTLTPKGRARLAEAMPLWAEVQARMVSGLGAVRWRTLRAELGTVIALARGD